MLINPLHPDLCEAGLDEAGRGALAGSLFAAAVILPKDFKCEMLNDSKKLSERKRYLLRDIITREALAWAVGEVSAEEVDEINVLNASFLAMERAVKKLTITPEILLVDGNRFRSRLTTIPYECIVKGDGKIAAIAAASILAKTFRDDYINGLAECYPNYGWSSNKGYPTKLHREAIAEFGVTPIHRKTFCGCDTSKNLFDL